MESNNDPNEGGVISRLIEFIMDNSLIIMDVIEEEDKDSPADGVITCSWGGHSFELLEAFLLENEVDINTLLTELKQIKE